MLDETRPDGWGSTTPCHFALTETGRRSLLTKLADTQEENLEVWEGLPGFQWYAPILRARPGVEVLAVHKDSENKFGRMPLLATRTYGAGKVLFMGTDGAWRWRRGRRGQIPLSFLGSGRALDGLPAQHGQRRNHAALLSPDQPLIDAGLTLNANVMNKIGEPLQGGDVTARITPPSGNAESIGFISSGDTWGAYAGAVHRPRARPASSGAHLQANRGQPGNIVLCPGWHDRADRPTGPAGSDGRDSTGHARQSHTRGPPRGGGCIVGEPARSRPAREPRAAWSHPMTAGLVIIMMGIFWIGRKAIGLI